MRAITRRELLGGLGAAGLGLSQFGEANRLTLEKSTLRLPNWEADGFKLALLADFHTNLGFETERARRAVGMALDQRPDALVIVGDFVNGSDDFRLAQIARSLEPIAGSGVPAFGVLGNHDFATPDPTKVQTALERSPMRLLRNEAVDVRGVTIAGVDDPFSGHGDFSFIRPDTMSRSILALVHEPDFVRDTPRFVGLQVSGHSHGGQICLPFGIPVHTPVGALRYYAGFYEDAPVPLYVTRGIGTTASRYRLFCPPEVSILTLRSA